MASTPYLWHICVALLSLGGVLLAWRLRPLRRLEHPRCPSCGYDLRGAVELRCSECGFAPATREELHRRPRSRWLMRLSLTCLLLGGVAGVVDRASNLGWWSFVPTDILVRCVPPTYFHEYRYPFTKPKWVRGAENELCRRDLAARHWRYLIEHKGVICLMADNDDAGMARVRLRELGDLASAEYRLIVHMGDPVNHDVFLGAEWRDEIDGDEALHGIELGAPIPDSGKLAFACRVIRLAQNSDPTVEWEGTLDIPVPDADDAARRRDASEALSATIRREMDVFDGCLCYEISVDTDATAHGEEPITLWVMKRPVSIPRTWALRDVAVEWRLDVLHNGRVVGGDDYDVGGVLIPTGTVALAYPPPADKPPIGWEFRLRAAADGLPYYWERPRYWAGSFTAPFTDFWKKVTVEPADQEPLFVGKYEPVWKEDEESTEGRSQ